jgi:hypothetical protein
VDAELTQKQQQLAAILREKEAKERERAALEETRRRQMEFQTGREESIQNLTRGLGLLEEAEFSTRRDAEQMAKALVGLRDALSKVQAIHEETWTKDTFAVELLPGSAQRRRTLPPGPGADLAAGRSRLACIGRAAAGPGAPLNACHHVRV